MVPNIAARRHTIELPSVIQEAISEAQVDIIREIDVVAATRGPGLPACLSAGFNCGKAIAVGLNKPFIGVHHMEAHLLMARMTEVIHLKWYTFMIVRTVHNSLINYFLLFTCLLRKHLWNSLLYVYL